MEDEFGFEKISVISADDIVLLSCASTKTRELLAFVLRSGDLILYSFNHEEDAAIIRWIPWYDDIEKKISSLAFNPSGESLLLACYDHNYYIVPALALLMAPSSENDDSSGAQASDVLKLPLPDFIPNEEFVPTALAWWVRHSAGDSTRHCAIIGSNSGQVIAYAIYKGTILFTTTVEGYIVRIEIFSKPELSYVIVTNSVGKQWRITLLESSARPENSIEKKFSSLSVNVVGKPDPRPKKTKSVSSPLKVDFTGEEWVFCHKENKLEVTQHTIGEQRLHVFCNSVINSYNSSFVTVERSHLDQSTVHKILDKTRIVAMTDSFFLLCYDKFSSIQVVSRTMSLCKTDANARSLISVEFNNDALIQKIFFDENERLLEFHSSIYSDHVTVLTNQGIYFLSVRKDPHELALNKIMDSANLRDAERISIIFGLDIQRLICQAGASKLSQGLHSEANQLYSLSPEGPLHQIMMLATTGHIKELQVALDNVKLSPSNKLQIANLKLLLFIYQLLVNWTTVKKIRAPFKLFLLSEEYDEVQAMRTLCRVNLFEELHFLMGIKGLHQSIIPALMTLVPALGDVTKMESFWVLMSDPSLTEALVAKQSSSSFHANLIRKNLITFSQDILKNLEKLYNPYQTTVRNFVSDMCKGELPKKMWVETYILICIHLSAQSPAYEFETMAMTSYRHVWEVEQPRLPYIPQVLSAGFRHGSIILNGIAYLWGGANSGCLGFGPTNQPVGGPKAVDVLMNLRKTVIAVSCGKTHTIALTNDGVYTWGDNSYGQLGTGSNSIRSWHPIRINILSSFRVISVCAGQYHSMALDDMNRVFSWGWGVHGQLGHGSVEDGRTPKIITSLSDKGIKNFCAGHAHSLFLDAEGRVWACGNNTFGQLGTGEMKKSSVPVQIYGLVQRVCFISAGLFQNCAIAVDGKLYQWGKAPTVLRSAAQSAKRRSRSEECPKELYTASDESAQHMTPKLVDTSSILDPIVKVGVGGEHAILLTNTGCVFTWGRNLDGQLGILASMSERRTQVLFNPVPVPMDAKIVDVSCGWNFTLVLDDEGKLWTWGAVHHFKGSRGAKLACLEGEIVVVNNKSRVIKFPQTTGNVHPIPTVLTINHQNKEQEMYAPAKLPSPLINSEWRMRMHFSIETLSKYYDPQTVIEQCLIINEHDACSKLAALSGDFATSIAEKLQSTVNLDQRKQVIDHYLSLELNDGEIVKDVLFQILKYFDVNDLSSDSLEDVLSQYENSIALPLFILLFGTDSPGTKYVCIFSTSFKVRLVRKILSSNATENMGTVFDGFTSIDEVIKMLEYVGEFIDINYHQITDESASITERRFFSM